VPAGDKVGIATHNNIQIYAFSALTLLVWWQEGHAARKN